MRNAKINRIPYSTHYIDNYDIKLVNKVLKSRSITQGNTIKEFEKKICKYTGSKYAVAVTSCTAGMHIACKALGFNSKSTMYTSVISFVSSANVGKYLGGNVDFIDIDEDTVNMCTKNLETKIKIKKPKIVIPVHMGGYPCDMKKINQISKKYDFKIIEDCAHALGAKYDTRGKKIKIGSCKFSDISVFSMHPVKSITTGEGGIITTNNKNTYLKLLRLRSHGINKLDDKPIYKNYAYSNKTFNPWYYEMRELGYHYRITDIQCALGIGQLKKLNLFLKKRREISVNYDKKFKTIKNISAYQKFKRKISSNHLYITKINYKKIKKTRADLMNYLEEMSISSQVHYIPIVMHPYYKRMGFKMKNYPNAQKYYNQCLSIPNFYKLTKSRQNYVINTINKFLNN